MFPQWHFPWIRMCRCSRRQNQRESDRARKRLNPEYLAVCGQCAEDSGHDDETQEKDLERIPSLTKAEPPDEPRNQEAVVQTLVRGQSLRGLRELGCKPERAQTQRLFPNEHLQDQEVQMQ